MMDVVSFSCNEKYFNDHQEFKQKLQEREVKEGEKNDEKESKVNKR